MDITKEIIISDRFKEDGKPVPFKIRTISQAENDALVKKAQKVDMVRGRRIQYQDDQKYTNSLIVACTVQPDFRDSELCQAYGTLDPLEVPGKMLLSGETAKLVEAIMTLNGFTIQPPEEEEEEAKNS
jgi:hypothetical protein